MGRRKKISKENILNELVAIGFARVTNYLFVEDGQICLRPGETLSDREAAAICSVEKTASGVKVKFYDKMKALELLGKEVGLFAGGGGATDGPGIEWNDVGKYTHIDTRAVKYYFKRVLVKNEEGKKVAKNITVDTFQDLS